MTAESALVPIMVRSARAELSARPMSERELFKWIDRMFPGYEPETIAAATADALAEHR
jgi:hypothetical protein